MTDKINGRTRPRWPLAWALPAAVSLLVLVLLAAQLAGAATFSPGTYRGSTSQSQPISFEFTATEVTSFRTTLEEPCSDGSNSTVTRFFNPGVTIPIHNGSFSRKFVTHRDDGPRYRERAVLKLTGAISGSSASGTVFENAKVYRKSNGSLAGTCRSGNVSWQALLRAP
jgi:hypothetical protein